MNDNYIKAKHFRIKQMARIKLGLMQFLRYPILNLLWLLVVMFVVVWKQGENTLLAIIDLPNLMHSIVSYTLQILGVILPILITMYIIHTIGEIVARKDESALVIAFSANELSKGNPVLIKRCKIQKSDVTMRIYYSNIALKIWQARQLEIADALNVNFVEPIQYADNNGKKIMLLTTKGRKPTERGTLYAE